MRRQLMCNSRPDGEPMGLKTTWEFTPELIEARDKKIKQLALVVLFAN
jgi:hypothetical protein